MKLFMLVAAALAMLSSCVGQFSADRGALRRRASFDLSCPASQLRMVDLDEKTVGVSGCGDKAVYVSACDGQPGHFTTTCKWVQN
jgi:hypothetical protein